MNRFPALINIQLMIFWRNYFFAIKKLRHFFTKTFIPGFYTEHHGDSGFHLRMPSKRIFACIHESWIPFENAKQKKDSIWECQTKKGFHLRMPKVKSEIEDSIWKCQNIKDSIWECWILIHWLIKELASIWEFQKIVGFHLRMPKTQKVRIPFENANLFWVLSENAKTFEFHF